MAAAKLKKQLSTEPNEYMKTALQVLEHHISNLEKRKRMIKIQGKNQKKGQNLNTNQLLAVSKFDEVTKTLDFAQDLCKQFQEIANESSKAEKLALERAALDVSKVKDILLIQDILLKLGQDNVRRDFFAGKNNAVQLTKDEMKLLDDLYFEVTPKRPTPNDGLPPFPEQLTAAAEHLLFIVEGKQKAVVNTTYEYFKKLFGKIQDCGYFDQNPPVVAPVKVNLATEYLIKEVPKVIGPAEKMKPIGKENQSAQVAMPPVPLAKSWPNPANLVPAPAPAPVKVGYFPTATHAPKDINYNSMGQQKPVNDLIKTVTGSFNTLQASYPGVQQRPAELAEPMSRYASVNPIQPPPTYYRPSPYAGPTFQPQTEPVSAMMAWRNLVALYTGTAVGPKRPSPANL